MAANLEVDLALFRSSFRQVFRPEIREEVAEAVDAQDDAFHDPVLRLRLGQAKLLIVLDLFSHAGGLPALAEPGGHRREDVAAMECRADRLKVVMLCGDMAHDEVGMLPLVN